MKIAGTAHQSTKGRFSFDFIDDKWFFIEVTLSFIPEDESSRDHVGRIVS